MSTFGLCLPMWIEKPTKEGCYLMADMYGRIGVVVLKGKQKHDGLLRCSDGERYMDPDFAPHRFCGPLNYTDLFPTTIVTEIKKAWKNLPMHKATIRLRRAEDWVKQHPKSPKAAKELVEAQAEMKKAKRRKA